MTLVGIDIVKYKHATFIMDASTSESLCNPFLFKNNKDGFQKFYDKLKKIHTR